MGQLQDIEGRGKKVGVATTKRAVSIRWLLEWAFQRENVSLEFGGGMRAAGYGYISSTAAIIQHEQLGCRVDGGGSSPCHPDADVVAAALAALPEGHGGARTAIWVAELARTGREPDWMADATPRCRPVGWRNCKHGARASTERVGEVRYVYRGRVRAFESRMCPVTYVDTADSIARARRSYLQWWGALLELREHFRVYDWLTAFSVTDEMPPRAPWVKSS